MSRGWRDPGIIIVAFLLMATAFFTFLLPDVSAERTFPGIQGIVTDGSGTPLEDVDVRIGTLDNSYRNGTSTNDTGYYMVNVSGPGLYRMGFVMDGYFEHAMYVPIPDNQLYTVDISLTPVPAESERVEGTVTFGNGAPAVDYIVTLLYEEGNDRFEYASKLGFSGAFGWDVFPGDFELSVVTDGIAMITEDVHVELGDGTMTYDLVLPDIPPKDVVIKGIVKDGSGPIEGAMVGIMDPQYEIFNARFSNETGYYELEFWAGFHYLISFADGYEGYFRGLELTGASTIWANITLMKEEFTLSGTVNGPDGSPLEGVTVQYLQRYDFPETNSALTDDAGHFSIDIAAGDGFLMIVDDNPFESGEFDAYFKGYEDVSDDIVVAVDLTENDMMKGTASVVFDTWSAFSSVTKMKLPLNNSRAGRAMVDLMMGDGDLVISQSEAEMWEEMMTGEDSDMNEGPFGNLTDMNLTLDGEPFLLDEGSLQISFNNITGPVGSSSPFELSQSASYTLTEDLYDDIRHQIAFNGTYNEGNEMIVMQLKVPDGWRHTGTTETLFNIDSNVNTLLLTPVEDPDPDDDIDFEWVTLTFHDDTFQLLFDPVGPVTEGEEVNFTLNGTDHLPDNEYEFVWSIDQEVVGTGTDPHLIHVFQDDGSYDVSVIVNDSYGRSTSHEMTVDVYNAIPIISLEVVGGMNRTFHEGDTVEISMNASDVEMDLLTVEWAMNGDFEAPLNYSEENRTRSYLIPDDGQISFQVRVTDDDNGTDIATVSLEAINVAPTFDYLILEEGVSGDLEVFQGENVSILISNIFDPSANDIHSIEWTIPDDGLDSYYFDEDASISIIFIETGNFTVLINVSDEDGGFSLEELTFNVKENYTFDQDGDGIPKWWEDKYSLSDENADDALMDLDSDDLTNLQEFDLGTDPRDSDTDNDGVPDNWDGYPLDATRYGKDSDGDGHYDWDEVQAKTDPFDKDDFPGKKESDGNKNLLLWIVLIIVGLIIAIGVVVIWASRSSQRTIEYEE